jgi:hypothetical protein
MDFYHRGRQHHTQRGYCGILHVESGAKITSANAAVAAQGHLYCS